MIIVASGIRAKSKYNAPGTVYDRYRTGNRRWSPWVGKEKGESKKKGLDELYWTVVVTVTGGCGASAKTYACNCPDKAKQIAATPGYAETKASGKEFVPRIFPASAKLSYKSLYQRYVRARQIFPQVQYVGVTGGNVFVYRLPTSGGIEKSRTWVSSQAGTPSDCKHIMAVKIYRAEYTSIPLDAPEDPLDI